VTQIIAVFGLSGVGKSTLINDFIKHSPEWTHLQAGQLIKDELKKVDHDKLRLEGNEAILKNQYLMIDAFWREIDMKQLSSIIFDGHSIIDTGTDILDIPVDIIRALRPNKLEGYEKWLEEHSFASPLYHGKNSNYLERLK